MADVKILVGRVRSQLETHELVLGAIRDHLKRQHWQYVRRTSMREALADIHYCTPTGRFLSGLLPQVLDFCKENGIDVEIERRYQPSPLTFPDPPFVQQRDYGKLALQAIQNQRRGGLSLATNAGKTFIAAELCVASGSVLYVTPVTRSDLVKQVADDFRGLQIPGVSTVCGTPFTNTPIVIASGATIVSRFRKQPARTIRWLRRFKTIILDEAHELTFRLGEALSYCIADVRIALSGTMWTEETRDQLIAGLFGSIIAEVSADELVESGFSARPYFLILPVHHTKQYVRNFHSYHSVYSGAIVKNKERNQLIVELADRLIKEGERLLIFLNRRDHMETIQRELQKLGWELPIHFGKESKQTRADMRARYQKGHYVGMIANVTLTTGISMTGITTVISGGAERGLDDIKQGHQLKQMIGRGFRNADGKERFLWIDLADDALYLKGHARSRRRVYETYDSGSVFDVSDIEGTIQWIKANFPK